MDQVNCKTTSYNPKRRHHKKKSLSEIVFICVLLAVPILHFLVFWIYVNMDTIALSFQAYSMSEGSYHFVGFDKYMEVFREFTKPGSVLPRATLNSFIIFLWNDFVIVPVSLFSAYMLFKKMFMANFFKVVFFLPSIISAVVMTMVFSFMLDSSFGILDPILTAIGLEKIIPFNGWLADKRTAFGMLLFYGLWTGVGSNIVLMTGAITRVPEEIFEAGRLDGLNMFQELWYIVIPLIGATLSTLLLMGTTVIFTYFLQPMLLTGDNSVNVGTYTIAFYIVKNVKEAGQAQINLGAALGVLCALIGTPIIVFARKILEKVFPVYEY